MQNSTWESFNNNNNIRKEVAISKVCLKIPAPYELIYFQFPARYFLNFSLFNNPSSSPPSHRDSTIPIEMEIVLFQFRW